MMYIFDTFWLFLFFLRLSGFFFEASTSTHYISSLGFIDERGEFLQPVHITIQIFYKN